jgi:tetraacyldisaccharide 4'-kinase
MPLETPPYWYNEHPPPLLARAIAPLYESVRKAHVALASKQTTKAALPVICIGNATMGGAGKTPATIALTKLLQDAGITKKPHILTRGYGRSGKAPTLVNADTHDHHDVGDEALLLARAAPTIVSADRNKGADMAAQSSADILIMDDGMQNYHLHHDISLMVINGAMGFGNGKLFPAGPLREPLDSALAKSDGFIIIGPDECFVCDALPADKPLFQANIRVKQDDTPPFDKPYLAFAGIGYPQKFFTTCKTAGLKLVGTQSYADHHPYSGADMAQLLDMAERLDARLITTEKDFMRIPPAWRERVTTLPITVTFDEPESLTAFIGDKLSGERQ